MTRRLRQKRYEKAAAEMDELTDAIQENIRNMVMLGFSSIECQSYGEFS